MKLKNSQSAFEFLLAFIGIGILSIGIIRIWLWFNANYAHRQIAFQKSRLLAARPTASDYKPLVDIGAKEDCPNCKYEPMDLSEKWVFGGRPSETVTGATIDWENIRGPEELCQQECLGQPDCGNTPEEFNFECVCFKECYPKKMCEHQIKHTANFLKESAKNFRDQAKRTEEAAGKVQKAIDDLPWWCFLSGDCRRTKRRLKEAKRNLLRLARELRCSAIDMECQEKRLQKCCEHLDISLQQACLEKEGEIGQGQCQPCQEELLEGGGPEEMLEEGM